MTTTVVEASSRFTERRCLDQIDERGVAIRARNAARAEGASWYAQACADHAVAAFKLGASPAEAILAARQLAIAAKAARAMGLPA